MGREATVQCRWAQESGLCKVLLEAHELILRGALRRKIPITNIRDISVENGALHFRVNADPVSLALGSALAQQWAKAIATPPSTLAKKLGITSASRLKILGEMIGEIEVNELQAAISEAGSTDGKSPTLILAVVKTPIDLDSALAQLPNRPSGLAPLWIIYPKGNFNGFGETAVRETLRQHGFIDTKIASVSPQLTALRFIWRRL